MPAIQKEFSTPVRNKTPAIQQVRITGQHKYREERIPSVAEMPEKEKREREDFLNKKWSNVNKEKDL